MFTSKAKSNVHLNTSLCLACSSSLPPRSSEGIFTTSCCQKPICASCISSNPRLARYNPCLACLGGVDVVGARSSRGKRSDVAAQNANIDGAVRDEETFVLGDDEDEGDLNEEAVPPPPYPEPSSSASSSSEPVTPPEEPPSDPSQSQEQKKEFELNMSNPLEYYIKRGDTLQGIALRFGVDGRELCRLNKLPPSTLSTTPHLLHTRTILILPPSARLLDKQGNSKLTREPEALEEEKQRAVRRARERAEKRLQTVTKEVDWRVAKAYVALADDPEEMMNFDLKKKEEGASKSMTGSCPNLEAAALDRYLADEEWEARELREGRKMVIPSIPPGQKQGQDQKWHWWK